MRRPATLLALLAAVFVGAGCGTASSPSAPSGTAAAAPAAAPAPAPVVSPTPAADGSAIAQPLTDASGRITKKPFGIFITRETSPVAPERFRGYHTGVDFETTPAEQDADVPVNAICDGKLIAKRRATGYGGVAVQSCVIAGRPATVIYGHVRLSSVSALVGDALQAGRPFAVLGKGYSGETDGERKHLHLGIHKGTAIVLLGYVQDKAGLDDWIDAAPLLR